MRASKSSPPRWLSPAVASTSIRLSPISITETSNVPPPRSYTSIFCGCPWSSPYANAADVGSLIIRSTFNPAIRPASFVACLCASLKYAGTVMTASETVSPRYSSASFFSFRRIMEEISCGVYCFPSIFAR